MYKKKIKLINVSTDEVYGDINKLSSKENDPYNPSSPYSASKASGDLLIKSYIRTYKVPAIITNCCNNYGPNQYPEKLIPTIIYKIIRNESIPIYGDGKNVREWMHVTDHCEALIQIAMKGKVGENYNIGSGIKMQNIEIMKKIISIFKEIEVNQKNKINFLFVKDRPGHDFRYSLNSSKLKRELKWKCKIDLTEGLKETIYWYIDKFNNDFFKNTNFNNRIGLKI
jgi:dTDP-glucose 4,6-dehydratase